MNYRPARLIALALGVLTLARPGASQEAEAPNDREIVVTGHRNKDSTRALPAASTPVEGETLQAAGVNDTTQLTKVAPAVQVRNSAGGGVAFYVRGVGGTVDTALAVPANAFSVDGVYYSRALGPDVVFYDLARIEILKGPQGTAGGRNATAGAFQVITSRPEHDFGASLTLEGGNYAFKHVTGAINAPLADELALRIAGNWLDRAGFFRDGYGDLSTLAGRIQLAWTPSDAVSLWLSGDYARQAGVGAGSIPRGPDYGTGSPMMLEGEDRPGDLPSKWVGDDPWLEPCSAEVRAYEQRRIAAVGTTPGQQQSLLSRWSGAECDGRIGNGLGGAALDLEVDLGFATWSSIAGFRRTDQDTINYYTPERQHTVTHAVQYSLESRLASHGRSSLDWLFGVFTLYEGQAGHGQYRAYPSLPVSALPAFSRFDIAWPAIDDLSLAAFTQHTYHVSEALRLTLGGRLSYEQKTAQNSQTILAYASLDPESLDASETVFSRTEGANAIHSTAFDYRVGLDWSVAKRSLLYANVASGFHAAGINPGASEGPYSSTYPTERLTAFALGAKNRWFGGLLQLNAEAYVWLYRNLQVTHLGLVNTGGETAQFDLRTDSAGRAHIFGIDLDLDYLVTDDDALLASVVWNESKYDDFTYADFGGTVDASGRRLAAAPRIAVVLAYTHSFALGAWGSLIAGLRTRYQSGVWMYYVHTPGMWQEPYTMTDLTLTFATTTNPKLNVTAYVRNLEGNAATSAVFDSISTGSAFAMLHPPRTFGVMVTGSL